MLWDLSLKWYGAYEGTFGGPGLYVTGGYGSIMTRFAQDVPGRIMHGHIVHSVECSESGVQVQAQVCCSWPREVGLGTIARGQSAGDCRVYGVSLVGHNKQRPQA